MCNITYLQPGIDVPMEQIANAATWNDDGHGWAVAAETGVMLTGRYMDADTALTTFKATRDAFPKAPAMFHSRLATHGTISLKNVHPFSVGKFAAVAHNGILPTKFQPTTKNAQMSDTAIMAAYWLAGRSQVSGIWTRKERRRIGRIIGTGNKLCILSVSPFLPEPRGYLVNASQGYWDDSTGAWFSSSSYRSAWTPKYSGGAWSGGWGSGMLGWGSDDDYEYGSWEKQEDGTWVAVKKSADVKCPVCNHTEGVDAASGVCLHCDTCLDCFEPLRGCQCYYPESSRNLLTAEEAAEQGEDNGAKVIRLDEEIEMRVSELMNGKELKS